jgi:hypothetical protein
MIAPSMRSPLPEDSAALMTRQIGGRLLKREGSEENGSLQSLVPEASGQF